MTEVNIHGANGLMPGAVQNNRLNAHAMRPYMDTRTGKVYVSVYKGGDAKDPKNYQAVPVHIQTNGTLRRDEWKALDEAVMDVSRQRLGGVEDLISNGLTYNLGNAMGTTVLEWHDVSDAMEADVTMDGVSRSKNDRPEFQTNYLPIPIIHSDYEINMRELETSRNMGNPLDVLGAQRATRKVQEKLENMLFTDLTYSYGTKDDRLRNSIYSYINFPDRNLVNLSIPWDNSACTAAMILQDVQDMKQASMNAYHYGPWMLYIPAAYERVLDDDYNVSGGSMMTVRERIMKLDKIKGIKVIDTLPTDNVLLVQMTSDVVRLVRGMGLTNVQWEVEGKFINKYKVLTIQVPQIRSDQNGKSGIVHMA